MSKKIEVPEGMSNAVREATHGYDAQTVNIGVEAALRWMDEELQKLKETVSHKQAKPEAYKAAIQDVRRMFLAPEPEVPEAIQDLWDASPTPDTKRRTIEAYRRGKESSKK
jgi:hypothetical protein